MGLPNDRKCFCNGKMFLQESYLKPVNKPTWTKRVCYEFPYYECINCGHKIEVKEDK